MGLQKFGDRERLSVEGQQIAVTATAEAWTPQDAEAVVEEQPED